MMDGNREFGELKAKLDALTEAFEDFRSETRTWQLRCEDLLTIQFGSRLRSLEVWRGWLAGLLAALGLFSIMRAAMDWLRK